MLKVQARTRLSPAAVRSANVLHSLTAAGAASAALAASAASVPESPLDPELPDEPELPPVLSVELLQAATVRAASMQAAGAENDRSMDPSVADACAVG